MLFGRLTLNAIPFNEPIIMVVGFLIIIASFTIILSLSYNDKWKYLWYNWFTSVDHKKIGIMYIILALIMLMRGFIDAIMMRSQQALSSGKNHINLLPPHHYDQIFTAHGVIMIFFVAMPFIVGFMNFIIPLQIGARDVAFPILNNLSFWLTFSGAMLLNCSLIIGEFARTGWLAYPPLSNILYNNGVGVDYWIWSLQLSGIGTILTGINFFVTIINMRTYNMIMFKMPVFIWTSLCSNILIIASFPVLTITLLMLTLDRYLDFHFFTNDMGGNIMMYVNLIWIWGHPEVYILILPIFGIFSEVVATFSRKYLFGYNSLVWATISITILSFIVWLHHFFTMGADSNVNSFFGIMTMIIAIPTGVKIFNWLFTMYKGKIKINSIMLWTIGFLITFSIGGMAGVLLANPSIDFLLHNSLFLVAHFHTVIIGGVVFGCFAGFNYWFPKALGFKLNDNLGIFSFWFWIVGFFTAFMPLYILGLMGMTRRLSQNIEYKFHKPLVIAAFGTFIITIGIIFQILQLYNSIKKKNNYVDKTGDPWNGRTLEWSVSSPPPCYNFAIIPIIYEKDDFWRSKITDNIKKIKRFFYKRIHMYNNNNLGIILSCFGFIFSFSIIWYIWWLCSISLFILLLIIIIDSFFYNKGYYVESYYIKKEEIKNMKMRFYLC
ncbi:Cytochrome bo(3) ubiquinol oxidase subunit 1 [Candidatus Annandia adelgestsuga]|uniref:Cytochrome bo(3) ubiquinol oxidase subunit 1 n=1 Tax=Candidatus Annandia adelgestsuga TaxID=1302411 RepID=A0A3Q9CLJ7_9ENTR|nr:cytochrome o ubiquinol oxidase subunit I [Candidatus Annandia adelgestsuga]AZP36379.1 Cytochrome bo(3) ubiquinol oxidase subunit 1 [Candidatus Annandia adelgestsuga]